jgi:hypothetical protein
VTAAPLAGVIDEVTQQFREVPAIPDKLALPLNDQLNRQVLPGIHLQQGGPQVDGNLHHINRRLPEKRATRGRRSLELMRDDVFHPVDLRSKRRRRRGRCRRIVRERCLHDGERRLQTMREIPQRIAITRHTFALTDQQRVEIPGDPAQLARIALTEDVAAPFLYLMNLALEPPHRRQHPTQ